MENDGFYLAFLELVDPQFYKHPKKATRLVSTILESLPAEVAVQLEPLTTSRQVRRLAREYKHGRRASMHHLVQAILALPLNWRVVVLRGTPEGRTRVTHFMAMNELLAVITENDRVIILRRLTRAKAAYAELTPGDYGYRSLRLRITFPCECTVYGIYSRWVRTVEPQDHSSRETGKRRLQFTSQGHRARS